MVDEGNDITELILHETEVDVQRVYRKAVDETQEKLDDYFRRYRAKDNIKRDQLKRGEITSKEYTDWKRGQLMIGQRWEEMRDTLARDLHNSNNIARSIVQGYMPEVYAVNHNYATFQVEKGSMMDTSYTLYDRQTVERIIRDQPDLLPPPGPRKKASIAAGKDIAWQRGQIQSVTLQSILQGESIPKMARRIAKEMGETNYKSTVRYARTSTTGAQNAGRVDAYKRAERMGIHLEQEWLATLDSRTRDSHRHMDGEHVKIGEEFSNGCRFPGDPDGPGSEIWNCRCTLVPRIEGIDQSNAPRNSKLGSMSYEEWQNEHWKPEEKEDLGELQFNQVGIGKARSIDQVNNILNKSGYFTTTCDLNGCDLDSAKSIASSYERVLNEFPFMRGKIGGVTAIDLGDTTYARNYIYGDKRIEVNKNQWAFGNFSNVVKQYEDDVTTRWHPYGTTAESVVVHELGHALDGLLTDRKIMGAGSYYSPSGKFNFHETSYYLRAKVAMSTGVKLNNINEAVSYYASTNNKEWFAECFAEYLTSSQPRKVASKFGEMLRGVMKDVT